MEIRVITPESPDIDEEVSEPDEVLDRHARLARWVPSASGWPVLSVDVMEIRVITPESPDIDEEVGAR